MKIHTELELNRLEAAALSWAGTPFCENSAVKGAGVSCHAGVAEVLIESGWLPRFAYPFLPVATVKLADVERCFGEQTQLFCRLDAGHQPGDILVFRFGRTCHFILALRGNRFFSVMRRAGIVEGLNAGWVNRLERIYRPL